MGFNKYLITHGFNVLVKDEYIIKEIKDGGLLTQWVGSKKCDWSKKLKHGTTLTMLMMEHQPFVNIRVMLLQGVKFDWIQQDNNGETAFMKLLKRRINDSSMLNLILCNKHDMTLRDHEGNTALMYAIRYQGFNVLYSIITKLKCDFTIKNNQKMTAFMYMIDYGCFNNYKPLLELDDTSMTALHVTKYQMKLKLLQEVLSYEQDWKHQDNQGMTLTMYILKYIKDVYILGIIFGIVGLHDWLTKDVNGRTASMYIMIYQRDVDLIKMLLNCYKHDISMMDRYGNTLLFYAYKYQSTIIQELVLKQVDGVFEFNSIKMFYEEHKWLPGLNDVQKYFSTLQTECIICLESLELKDKVYMLDCCHFGHMICVFKWLQNQPQYTCPYRCKK